jgi:hypothetical protein
MELMNTEKVTWQNRNQLITLHFIVLFLIDIPSFFVPLSKNYHFFSNQKAKLIDAFIKKIQKGNENALALNDKRYPASVTTARSIATCIFYLLHLHV